MTAAPIARMSFAEFYATYHPRVLRWAAYVFGRDDCEDVAQEVLARALAAYDRLDPDRDPWPWLTAIARNVVRDRQRAHRAVPLDAYDVEAITDERSAYDAAVVAEQGRLTLRALARLPKTERDLLLLRDWHELSIPEIARLDGRNQGALRQHLLRARRRFMAEFTRLGGRALGLAATAWAKVRRRATDLTAATSALPLAAPLAGVVTAVVVLAAPVAARPNVSPAADVMAARPVTSDLSRRPVAVTTTPRAGRSTRPPTTRPHRDARTVLSIHRVPGTPGSRRRDYALIPIGDRAVQVDGGGRNSEQAPTCSLRLGLCPQ